MKKPTTVLHCAIALVSLCSLQTAFAATPKVVVTNGSTNPVPVNVQNEVTTRNANEPGSHPFVVSGTDANNTGSVALIQFTVPAGKRLVIESVTVKAAVPAGQTVYTALVSTLDSAAMVANDQYLALTPQGTDLGGDNQFAGTHPIHTYSDSGLLQVSLARNNSTGTWNAYASISGYLVDMPASAN